jgi:thiosulfate dehydrogenase [quinone] large subunit
MSVTNPRRTAGYRAAAPTVRASGPAAIVWGVTRIVLGWIFLWAFLDKLFGLGYATPSEGAWLDGGSPTRGFLANAATGPFEDIYRDMAGQGWADWLFMIGLLGIGVALILGIGMRIACISGALLYVLMWSVVLPPENNPIVDDHIVGALVLIGLMLIRAGDFIGLGRMWRQTAIVRRMPWLE